MSLNQPIGEQIANNKTVQNISEGASNLGNNISETFSDIKSNVSSGLNDFSSKSLVSSSDEFLSSNSIIAKFVFLILVLIVFMILLSLGVKLIKYFLKPNTNPYVIKGLINGTQFTDISQDPNAGNSVTIYRSNNQNSGIEFTWTAWLQILNVNSSNSQQYQHVFSKGGNGNFDSNGIMAVNNAPGVYISPQNSANVATNNLHIVMSTISEDSQNTTETVEIQNVPINHWFNLAVRIQNKIMDVYINGVITQRVSFQNVPLQNYDDVFVCGNGGFSGYLSDLRYFDHALSAFELTSITMAGPNLRASKSANAKKFDYLSGSWYYGTSV